MKNIRKILIALIILNLLCIIIEIVLLNKKDSKVLPNVQLESRTVEEKNKIYPIGSYKFTYLYDGEVDLDNFYARLYDFIKYVNKIKSETNELSRADLKKYFKDNKDNIFNNTGIEKEADFLELVRQIKECDIQNGYSKVEMIANTYENNNEYCSIQIDITYSEARKIKVIGKFSKKYSTDRIVKFIPVKEE